MTKIVYFTMIGILLGMFGLVKPVLAQETTTIEDFSLTGPEKETVQLQDFKDKKAVVVIFTSSHCSWALQYIDRLNALYATYDSQDVAFIAINSNDPSMSQRDGIETMSKIARYQFPYLKDKDQSVARLFKVVKNPEVFVLVPKDDLFEMVYRGKIDDNPLDEEMVEESYLENGIVAALAGEKLEEDTTTPNGCGIKWIETNE